MRSPARTVSPTVLLILLLLPVMIVGAAHVVAYPDHDDHCVLCLLYRSIATAVATAAVSQTVRMSIRQRFALAPAGKPYSARPRPMGRSPPAL